MRKSFFACGTIIAFGRLYFARLQCGCSHSGLLFFFFFFRQKFDDPLALGVIRRFAQQLPVALDVLTPDESLHGRYSGPSVPIPKFATALAARRVRTSGSRH